MTVATITLNPALDLTVRTDNFQINALNRGQSMQIDPGGKGINVASILADYGMQVIASGFLGADNSEQFERLFKHKHIADHCIRIPGNTRISIKIVDEIHQQTTDINLPGLTPDAASIDILWQTIDQLMETCEWFVLSGNLSPGIPVAIYAEIIRKLQSKGKKIALDTSGEALKHGVLAGPTFIKPNIEELQYLTGQMVAEADIERVARSLLSYGIPLIVVSMGDKGALFVDQNQTIKAAPPKVFVKSTVGAGDALVAGIVAAQEAGKNLVETARMATAFAVGTLSQIGAYLPPSEVLLALSQSVDIQLRSIIDDQERRMPKGSSFVQPDEEEVAEI